MKNIIQLLPKEKQVKVLGSLLWNSGKDDWTK